MAGRGVDLRSATGNKAPDYSDLAALITKAHRRRIAPEVDSAQLSVEDSNLVLHVEGNNLAVAASRGFPYALLDGAPRVVRAATPQRVSLEVPGYRPSSGPSRLTLALDPLTVITMELQP